MAWQSRRFSLLAVEVGGYSPSSLETARHRDHDTIVVAQQPYETGAVFASRLVERIKRVKKEGSSIVKAALACNGRADMDALAARLLVVRTIFAESPDLCDSDVTMSTVDTNPGLRLQLEAIRYTVCELELPRATSPAEPKPGDDAFQKVA